MRQGRPAQRGRSRGERAVASARARATASRPSSSIEPMRRRDVAAIQPIEQVSYPRPWSPAVFQSEIELTRRGERHYIVARRGGELVGYAGMMFVVDDAHVTNIATSPAHRQQGIGTTSARRARLGGDRARVHRADPRGADEQRGGAGAVPQLRVRAGRHPPEVLRERRGCDRHVVSRDLRAGVSRTPRRTVPGGRPCLSRDASSTRRRSCSASRRAATRPLPRS